MVTVGALLSGGDCLLFSTPPKRGVERLTTSTPGED